MVRKKEKSAVRTRTYSNVFFSFFFNFYCCQQIVWSNQSQSRESYQYIPQCLWLFVPSLNYLSRTVSHNTLKLTKQFTWLICDVRPINENSHCLKSPVSALLRGIKVASPVWKSWTKAFVSPKRIKLAGNCLEHFPTFGWKLTNRWTFNCLWKVLFMQKCSTILI